MTPDSPIDRDVACAKCGYNVRTLAIMARCTECGFGEIVAGLAEAGLIMPGENDSPADFIGVCRFAELLARR